MDKVTPEAMSDPKASKGAVGAGGQPDHNGLSPHVAAVEAARERLGRDLDMFNTEVRAQMGKTAEKTAWKVAATGAGVIAGYIVRKSLIAGWKAARKSNPPSNPAARDTQWGEALAWTLATSVGVGVARLVATRGAAGAWEKYTGSLPPGLEEVSA